MREAPPINEYISDPTLTTSGSVHLAVSYGGPHDVDPGGFLDGGNAWCSTFNSSDDDALLLTLSSTGVFEHATPIWALGGVYFAGTMWGPMGGMLAVGYFSDSLTFGPPTVPVCWPTGSRMCSSANWTPSSRQAYPRSFPTIFATPIQPPPKRVSLVWTVMWSHCIFTICMVDKSWMIRTIARLQPH
ncbi:MAG: hypothetical protein IPG69_07430 [Flavobacteriales bacterium]|nr:hypothetical protein [Flavobacteriales bacterium]